MASWKPLIGKAGREWGGSWPAKPIQPTQQPLELPLGEVRGARSHAALHAAMPTALLAYPEARIEQLQREWRRAGKGSNCESPPRDFIRGEEAKLYTTIQAMAVLRFDSLSRGAL